MSILSSPPITTRSTDTPPTGSKTSSEWVKSLRAMSIEEASRTFDRMTSDDIDKFISSLALQFGVMPSVAWASRMTLLFGRVAVPANLSPRQAKGEGWMTSGTSGRISSISSESVALQEFMVNKLRRRTDLVGSTLYSLTWKKRVTPSGRSIHALRAVGRRTSAKGSDLLPTIYDLPQVGWNTARATDGSNGGPNQAGGALPADAALAGWTTSLANSTTGPGSEGRDGGLNIQTAVQLASWTTPSARDWKDSPGMATEREDGRSRLDQLPRQANLAGYPTPKATEIPVQRVNMPDRNNSSLAHDGLGAINLYLDNAPARLTVSGEMLTGSSATTWQQVKGKNVVEASVEIKSPRLLIINITISAVKGKYTYDIKGIEFFYRETWWPAETVLGNTKADFNEIRTELLEGATKLCNDIENGIK